MIFLKSENKIVIPILIGYNTDSIEILPITFYLTFYYLGLFCLNNKCVRQRFDILYFFVSKRLVFGPERATCYDDWGHRPSRRHHPSRRDDWDDQPNHPSGPDHPSRWESKLRKTFQNFA